MKKVRMLCLILLLIQVGFTGCALRTQEEKKNQQTNRLENEQGNLPEEKKEKEIPLTYKESLELSYAKLFQVDYYEGGYTVLTLVETQKKILVVPQGSKVPEGISSDTIVLKRPIKNIYLVATAVMDIFDKLDSLDAIRLSGQKPEGWYIENAKTYMNSGKMVYAGKYNKPDYERIVSENCSIAIENTMILHSPEVIEKLNEFGVPVMIDASSSEKHPLGRVEWIKFYGALLGKEKEAQKLFDKQTAIFDKVVADNKLNKTVAFFYITSNGMVQIRRPSDYVPKMIEFAGGRYIFENIEAEESKMSTMNIQMEEFYKTAKEADYLIYNSTIDGGVDSIEALLNKAPLLKDFKAVKENHVWCTTNDLYQQSMSIGYLIEDMHNMLLERTDSKMKYLFQIK